MSDDARDGDKFFDHDKGEAYIYDGLADCWMKFVGIGMDPKIQAAITLDDKDKSRLDSIRTWIEREEIDPFSIQAKATARFLLRLYDDLVSDLDSMTGTAMISEPNQEGS
jgi:hypothetical protein